jgi:hypothetical protein
MTYRTANKLVLQVHVRVIAKYRGITERDSFIRQGTAALSVMCLRLFSSTFGGLMRELSPLQTGVTFILSDIKDRLVSYVTPLYLNVSLSAFFKTHIERVLGMYMRILRVI